MFGSCLTKTSISLERSSLVSSSHIKTQEESWKSLTNLCKKKNINIFYHCIFFTLSLSLEMVIKINAVWRMLFRLKSTYQSSNLITVICYSYNYITSACWCSKSRKLVYIVLVLSRRVVLTLVEEVKLWMLLRDPNVHVWSTV